MNTEQQDYEKAKGMCNDTRGQTPTAEQWSKAAGDCKTSTESLCCKDKPFDWKGQMPYIVCGIIIAIIFLAWLNSVWSKNIKAAPPSPIQSTQITMFNVGSCQYVLVAQDKALAVVHRGDCTNHTTLHPSPK